MSVKDPPKRTILVTGGNEQIERTLAESIPEIFPHSHAVCLTPREAVKYLGLLSAYDAVIICTPCCGEFDGNALCAEIRTARPGIPVIIYNTTPGVQEKPGAVTESNRQNSLSLMYALQGLI